jgi:hypothetical protein
LTDCTPTDSLCRDTNKSKCENFRMCIQYKEKELCKSHVRKKPAGVPVSLPGQSKGQLQK